MSETVQSICIVGGGSAGWLTAAYALKHLPWATITLVESPNIPTVGVGEATILNFGTFMDDCDIPYHLWQNGCDAVAKAGILFPEWNNNTTIWHPFHFEKIDQDNGVTYSRSDLGIQAGLDLDSWMKKSTSWYITAVEKKQLPDLNNHRVGFHLDAIKLANFLSCYLKQRYLNTLVHKLLDVTDINVADNKIVSISANQETVVADLFIDCTGFKRLLSSKVPGSSFIRSDKMLFNNAAVATPVRYKSADSEIPPYTICHPCEYGWIWETSIEGRIGSGLVYDRELLSREQAEIILTEFWGEDRLITKVFNHIKFEPEFNENNWRGNCFSVGLSSGFVEPLESTGLGIMVASAKYGIDLLRKGYYTSVDQRYFNSTISSLYEDSVDFVGLHYMNNNRSGPFWDKVKKNFVPSDSLKKRIEVFSNNYQSNINDQFNTIFKSDSWKLWLLASNNIVRCPNNTHAEFILNDLCDNERKINNYDNKFFIRHRKGMV